MNNEKEIFGAFDSELMHQEIFIPEGFTATIDGNKIILTRIENEDERVRKALITYFQGFPYNGIEKAGTNPKEAIAWLKKQGNQKSKKVSIWKHWKDGICGNGEGKLIYLIKNGDAYSLSSSLGFECDYIDLSELDNLMLEKQGEQKLPIEKFHEGEWVVFNDKHESVYQIEKIENFQYILRHILGGSMPLSFSHEDMIRVWTVKDARDGDVLTDGDYPCLFKSINEGTGMFVYCGINGSRNFVTKDDGEDNLLWDDALENYCPATKEQRDTLFAKMKESGYEWNAEKKELKKIEQPKLTAFEEEVKDMMDDYRDAIDENAATTEEVKERAAYLLSLIPHKPAEWSEEDESNIKALESILYYDKKLPKDLYLRLNDWLKSLRPQNRWKVVDKGIYVKEPALAQKKDKSEPGQGFVVCYDHILTPDVYERYIMLSDINCHSGWKPSDKQMEALLSEVNGWVKGCPKQIVLESLYDDLKKLKG